MFVLAWWCHWRLKYLIFSKWDVWFKSPWFYQWINKMSLWVKCEIVNDTVSRPFITMKKKHNGGLISVTKISELKTASKWDHAEITSNWPPKVVQGHRVKGQLQGSYQVWCRAKSIKQCATKWIHHIIPKEQNEINNNNKILRGKW